MRPRHETAAATNPGAFTSEGNWNPDGQLHHRGDTDKLVRTLVKERRYGRISPRAASEAIQASAHILAFPSWRQWETCTDWATAWTQTSAEEAVKRGGETCTGEHHWCGGGHWLPGPEKSCPERLHREKPGPERVAEIVARILGKAPKTPAQTLSQPETTPPPPDEEYPGWEAVRQP